MYSPCALPVPRPWAVREGFSALAAISESEAWLPLLSKPPPNPPCWLLWSSDHWHCQRSFAFHSAKLPLTTRMRGGWVLVEDLESAPLDEPGVRLQNEMPVRVRFVTVQEAVLLP